MSLRLLSALTAIERALLAQSAAPDAPAWAVTRMVNYHHNVARLTVASTVADDARRGSIFLQTFTLADGSVCLKANLCWHGCDAFPALPVYTTPQTDWAAEFSRIAAAWLAGPPSAATETEGAFQRLPSFAAMTG